jgi:murein DD-endopeptidase MepM/ murein hydrolase activator NlpD
MKTINLHNVHNSKKIIGVFLTAFTFLFLGTLNADAAVSISITPNEVLQGEPIMIQIDGAKMSEIKKLTFDKKTINIFEYKNKPSALVGIDLNKKIGDYTAYIELKNGDLASSTLKVTEREKYQTYLAVPDQLGGNSVDNQTKVVSTLAQENAILAVIKTVAKTLWTNKFIYPLKNPVVTDPYGFSRTSGAAAITHKGTDFKAPLNTKLMSINRGIVRVAKNFQVYGKTVVIDHGYGVMSFYLHMSKINVNVGELVQQGQTIGLAGGTGFATGPHLHFSVRINNISIDPIKFLDLFK